MSQTSPNGSQPPRRTSRLWLILCSRPVIGSLLVLCAILAGLGWWALKYINEELAPTIAQNLSKTLNRPVKVGQVEGYSLAGIRFGPSSIPPYRKQLKGQTVEDADAATVKAIDARFNLWQTLWTQTLKLDVTLVQPTLYIDQAQDGQWLQTTFTPGEEGWLKIQLENLYIKDGKAVVDPFGAPQRQIKDLKGKIALSDHNQKINVNGQGSLDSGGEAKVESEWLQDNSSLQLKVQVKELAVAPVMGFLPSDVPLQVRSGKVNGKFQLQYQPQTPLKLSGDAEVKQADVRLPQQAIRVKAQRVKSNFRVAYLNDKQLPKLAGKAQFQGTDLFVPEDLILQNGRSRQQQLKNTRGTVQFIEKNSQVKFEARGNLAAGGRLSTKGETSLDLAQVKVLLRAQNVAAPLLDQAFGLPVRVRSGRVDANLALKLHQDQQPNVQGTAQMRKINAQIVGLPQSFTNTNGLVRFRGLTTSLERVTARYGSVPLAAKGTIDVDRGYDITAQTPQIEIGTALKTLGVPSLPFPVAGKVGVPTLRVTGAIERPLISGVVASGGATLDRVPFEQLTAQFRLDNPRLQVTNIRAIPVAGGTITGSARTNLTPGAEVMANLNIRNVSGDQVARLYGVEPGVAVGPVFAQARLYGPPDAIQTQVAFQAPEATYPTRGQVLVSQQTTFLQNIVAQVAGGTVQVNGQLNQTALQANAKLAGISLQEFSPDLKGTLSGRVDLSGPLASLGPETIRAQGDVRFSQGLSLIEHPLETQFRWNGQQIVVQNATAPGFRASGTIAAQLQSPDGPQITALDLNIKAQNYDLGTLATLGPPDLPVVGRADLTGRLTGTPEAPNLMAAVQVRDLAVSRLVFESSLNGRLDLDQRRGLDFYLAGDRDRIQVALTPDLQPESFLIRRDQAIAQGRTQGDLLLVDVQQFPLRAFNLQPAADFGLGPVSGLVSGQFEANLPQQTFRGSLAVAQPGIDPLQGDRFTANVSFADGIATLSKGELLQRDSRYQIEGSLATGQPPEFSGQINVIRGRISDITAVLQALAFAEPGSYEPTGTAADVQTIPVGQPDAPLGRQLQRLAEIDQLIAQQQAQQEAAEPSTELADLEGQYSGQLQFSSSVDAGLAANFDFRGQDFVWNDYTTEQVIAKGTLQDGVLTFDPIRLASGDSIALFTGQLSGDRQAGQLSLKNVSVEPLQQFVDLPIEASGKLNGTATLAGSLANPQLNGELSLAEAQLNQKPLDQARASFSYNQAQLQFDSTASLSNSEPISIQGTVPYQLPFAEVEPASDQLAIDANVKDNGLALLNLFTDQIAWVDGQGRVDLKVRGTLEQPLINGDVTLKGATLESPTLAEPITNVTGSLEFNRNLLQVPRLTGQLTQGQLVATGNLGIFEPTPTGLAPLTTQLNDLDVELTKLYEGNVDGDLVVTGSLLQPELGGTVQLANGKLLLAEAAASEGSALPAEQPTPPQRDSRPLQFNNLTLRLAENVSVSQPPVLNVVALGDLTLNGSIEMPRPKGTIQFRKGSVNLFTSRFRVDSRRENYAEFDPRFGLDPYLNIGMVTTVTEVVQGRSTPLNEVVEVPPSALGSIESVRVRATVDGRASELVSDFDQVVTVTSNPSRSQGEIITLLGGGVSEAVLAGQAGQAAASLASSALFSTVQGALEDALGSRVLFRAFPVLIPVGDQDSSRSVLSFGTEIGYDVTNNFSVSVLQILTGVSEPTLFNLNYDINDQLRARAAISTDGEGVGIIEYRIRF